MPLSLNFTDAEVEYAREAARIPNSSDRIAVLVEKLDALNSAQVIAVQRDLDEWKLIEYGTESSKGGIKGTDYSAQRNRDYITNKLRERLDYPPLQSTIAPEDLAIFSMGLINWAGGGEGDEYSR